MSILLRKLGIKYREFYILYIRGDRNTKCSDHSNEMHWYHSLLSLPAMAKSMEKRTK